ncbi:polysaccharide deacetylase family protein [Arachidicoccus ginsenosidivorans]|uniref:polysaccharide deacetylase family protein n=1 Tax=Arachidicoccus ginsenosidivorans TaxID=496057 RepID=UPI001CEF9A8D|nr:polysaccharide deacetylase family protein [Arachidicoccus ginsenosidivorans]
MSYPDIPTIKHRTLYLIKTNFLFKLIYPGRIWKLPPTTAPDGKKALYLSFDDGPHPEATVFALETLKAFNAKATFFCLGKNVRDYKDIFQQILNEGHTVGNHSFNHLNGWKTKTNDYLADIKLAGTLIDSPLFRPPYGRMSKSQQAALQQTSPETRIVMWDLLSGDFDINITPEKCWHNVQKNTRPGSIIVFHDSTKAFERMRFALPATLEYFSRQGYVFKPIPMEK